MKVCTDACLFGAWCTRKMNEWVPDGKNILDIGTGTGLLSLMAAQKTNAMIDAVDLDAAAVNQAAGNFSTSPWKDRLNAVHASINDFEKTKEYDFIISNPPFYEDDLRSPDEGRTAAMHDSKLTLEQLVNAIGQHLSNDGYAAVLLPFPRTNYFETTAIRKGLHVVERAFVRQTSTHHFFRSMLLLSRYKPFEEVEEEITIHDDNRQYTPEFFELLKDYYLKL